MWLSETSMTCFTISCFASGSSLNYLNLNLEIHWDSVTFSVKDFFQLCAQTESPFALTMPLFAGVDVPNWCLAAGAVLTPAAVYAYLLRQGRERRAYFAATPQLEETSAIFGGIDKLMECNDPLQTWPKMQEWVKELGPTFGMRLPRWLFPKNDFFIMTADPEVVKEIQSKKDIFHSRPTGMVFDTTIPLGLLSLRSEGPHSQWALHRRLVSPLFSDKFLEGYSEQVFEKADLLRYILKEKIAAKGAEVKEVKCDIQLCLKLLTLDIISSIGFGFNSNSIMMLMPEKHPRALSKAAMEHELESLWPMNSSVFLGQFLNLSYIPPKLNFES